MTHAQAFDTAFMPVEPLADGIANVTDNGVTLLVQPGYCAHCRGIGDGVPWCIHKEAAFGVGPDVLLMEQDAQDQRETYADALR